MTDRRKLQAEIDRCLKKVSDGVEIFHEIWEKAQNASSATQREKHEAELKKEIKRLQRLRDNVKSWLSSSEVIDKTQLQETRRLIESLMEKFKVMEREMKTKAYSKEGLSGVVQKIDPVQKEKEEVTQWLVSSIDNLNIQIDQFECEIETILTQKSKKGKVSHRVDEIRLRLEKHRFHIKKLETMLRRLDNDTLEVEKIKRIMDDVNYYIESCLEEDFEGDDYLYEELGLDDGPSKTESDFEEDLLSSNTSSTNSDVLNVSSASETIIDTPPKATASAPVVKCNSAVTKPAVPVVEERPRSPSADGRAPKRATVPASSSDTTYDVPRSSKVNKTQPKPEVPASQSAELQCSEANKTYSAVVAGPSTSRTSVNDLNFDSIRCGWYIDNTKVAMERRERSSSRRDHYRGGSNTKITQNRIYEKSDSCDTPVRTATSVNSRSLPTRSDDFKRSKVDETPAPMESKSETKENSFTIDDLFNSYDGPSPQPQATPEQPPSYYSLFGPSLHNQIIPPVLGTPKFSMPPNSPFNRKHERLTTSFENAYKTRSPLSVNLQKPSVRAIRQPCEAPQHYPKEAPVRTYEAFKRLTTGTLFFVFYYMEGTEAQLYAAKALQRQSWRFHTKLRTWFRRHGPFSCNEVYERGVYLFFDYTTWKISVDTDFIFHFKFLDTTLEV